MPTPNLAGEHLKWDTEFFGYKIARSENASELGALEDWCRREAVDCLYLLVPPPTYDQSRDLTERHFCLVDVRCTLRKEILGAPAQEFSEVSRATEEDRASLYQLAESSFTDSRFTKDPHFSAKSGALFKAWVDKGLRNQHTEWVLVWRHARGDISGFISVSLDSKREGRIELIAVSPEARVRGLGAKLIAAGESQLVRQGARAVTVATQVGNLGAIRLYEKAGFRFHNSTFCYHRWFHEAGESVRLAA